MRALARWKIATPAPVTMCVLEKFAVIGGEEGRARGVGRG